MALLASVFAVAAGTGGAMAQQAGQPSRGRALAEARCTTCHAIDRGQMRSPHADAAPFAAIAATPGMTETALLAALRTSHRAMPNLILDDADTRNVIAYILSLKTAP
ncbi:MAG: c-type cytochrome [Alphaproteobacteria bacterium]|nr:c-type cytochrome [Alphaproteobacteria bacterium]